MEEKAIGYLLGDVVKVAIEWNWDSDPAVTLDTIDFHVEYYCNDFKKVVLQKNDLIRKEETVDGNTVVSWFFYADTLLTGPGPLRVKVYARIPDADAPGGYITSLVERKLPAIVHA